MQIVSCSKISYINTFIQTADTLITRDCLSNLISVRFDIPADKFEGCRPAANHPQLGVNVQNSIKELDIHRYLNN